MSSGKLTASQNPNQFSSEEYNGIQRLYNVSFIMSVIQSKFPDIPKNKKTSLILRKIANGDKLQHDSDTGIADKDFRVAITYVQGCKVNMFTIYKVRENLSRTEIIKKEKEILDIKRLILEMKNSMSENVEFSG